MAPDEFQQAWQAHSAQTRVVIDADLLREEVHRDQREFQTMIFFRDFREIGIEFLLIPTWLVMGYLLDLPWTWYLGIPTFLWTAGFMLVHRRRHRQEPHRPEDPLLVCVQRSLTEVEDQIWLLRNVFWWYLLPPGLAVTAFFAQVSWHARGLGGLFSLLFFLLLEGLVLAVYGWVYHLNQRAVRQQLEPRQQELQKLRDSLQNENTEEAAHAQIALPDLPFAGERFRAASASPFQLIVGLVLFIALILLVFFIVYQAKNWDSRPGSDQYYPRRSPFKAVRWEDSQPEVKVDDEWYRLIALDGIPTEKMIAFSKETYDEKWQKRFEEDLVELMTRMGHPPDKTVTLEVQSLTSSEKQTLKEVRMTYANRGAIRSAAQARERDAAGE